MLWSEVLSVISSCDTGWSQLGRKRGGLPHNSQRGDGRVLQEPQLLRPRPYLEVTQTQFAKFHSWLNLYNFKVHSTWLCEGWALPGGGWEGLGTRGLREARRRGGHCGSQQVNWQFFFMVLSLTVQCTWFNSGFQWHQNFSLTGARRWKAWL